MTEMAQAPDSVEDLDILIVYNIYYYLWYLIVFYSLYRLQARRIAPKCSRFLENPNS